MTEQEEPKPIRIRVADLDDGADLFEQTAEGSGELWLVGRVDGLPVAIAELDLDGPASQRRQVLEQLGHAAEQARRTPRDRIPDAGLPRISVVVPSIVSRLDSLRECLARLEELDYPDYEIILVDNRTQVDGADPLPDILAGLTRTRVVAERRAGISAARNAGIEASSGEIIAFTDDDVQVDLRWLRSFGERFVTDDRAEIVTGLVLPAELDTPAQIWYERFYGGFSGERTFTPVVLESDPRTRARVVARTTQGQLVRRFAIYGIGSFGAGANMAFRASVLKERGFDLALGTGTPARGGEDLEMLIRVLFRGGRVVYDPAAVVWHQHRREYDALVRQMVGNGLGYTAMLCAVIADEPRHLIGLASQVPIAGWRLTQQNLARLRGRNVAQEDAGARFPSELAKNELIGMLEGPTAYWKSRRQSMRLDRRASAVAGGPERASEELSP